MLAAIVLPLPTVAQAPIAVPTADAAHPYRPGRLLVGYGPSVSPDTLAAGLTAQGMTIKRIYPELRLIDVSLPLAQVSGEMTAAADQAFLATEAAQAALAALPGVTYVDKDYLVQAAQVDRDATPISNDPRVGEQWALAKVNAAAAWAFTRGDATVPIAVIDSGYDTDHPDLPASQLWVNQAEQNGKSGKDDDGNGYVDDLHGWDWVALPYDPDDGDNDPDDEHGHGTHVFGIIAAATDNNTGVAGLGPDLRIAPLRVLNASGTGFVADVVSALEYARVMGFRVTNLSLTVSEPSLPLKTAVEVGSAAGMLIIAATGNTGRAVLWPAAYPQTVAVGATTSSDLRASFSNVGPEVDLVAPGSNILSTYIEWDSALEQYVSTYQTLSGTSMASPHVAAAAALLWSLEPDLTSDEVIAVLKGSAVDINQSSLPGPDNEIGAGRLDVAAALRMASVRVSLTLSPTVAQVNGSPVHYRIEVRDRKGIVETEQMPVQLTTTLGSFQESSLVKTWTVNATGVYTGALYPSTVAGVASVQASIGGASAQAQLTIVPGPASQVLGPGQGQPVTAIASDQLAITFWVQDRYGNSVVDKTPIRFESEDGALEPESSETRDGRASTVLTVHAGAAAPPRVRVIIPGTSVSTLVPIPFSWRLYVPVTRGE